MKKVSLKFEQSNTTKVTIVKAVKTKNSKGETKVIVPALTESITTLVTCNTKELEYTNNDEAIKIVCEIVTAVNGSIQLAKQMKQNCFILGGYKFFINKKFNLYLNLNGQDFSLADVNTFMGISTEFKLSNLEQFAKGLYTIFQSAEGKNCILSLKDSKKIDSVTTALKLA